MKKIILPFVLFAIIANACEQKFETWQVPKEVLHNFKQQYPSVEANWEIEDSVYEAMFKTGDDRLALFYNKNGDLLQSEKVIKSSELPLGIVEYMSQNYKTQEISQGKKITKNDGDINYKVPVDGLILVFSEEGQFIKKEIH